MSDIPLVDELKFADVDDSPNDRRSSPAKKTTSKTTTRKAAPPYKQGALIEPLTKVYATFAVGCMPIAPRTGEALINNAEACAQAWDDWARTSPTVRRMLYPLLNVSAGAAVFAAHLPILMCIVMEARPNSSFADTVESYLAKVTPDMGDDEPNAD